MLPGETDLFDILFIIKVCIGKVMSQHIKWHKTAEYPRDTTPPSEINAKIYIWNYTQITLRKQFERRRKKERKKEKKKTTAFNVVFISVCKTAIILIWLTFVEWFL